MESDRVVVGIKQSLKAIENGEAKKAYIAKDAEVSLTGKVEELCSQKKVPVEFIETMSALGAMCNISVGASVAVECI